MVFPVASNTPVDASESHEIEKLFSIDDTEHISQRVIEDQCNSLRFALFTYRQIMRSNPVYGKDASRGAEFDWIDEPRFKDHASTVPNANNWADYTQSYLDLFGGVTVPSLVQNMSLYQSDNATCLSHFLSEEDG